MKKACDDEGEKKKIQNNTEVVLQGVTQTQTYWKHV